MCPCSIKHSILYKNKLYIILKVSKCEENLWLFSHSRPTTEICKNNFILRVGAICTQILNIVHSTCHLYIKEKYLQIVSSIIS